MIFGEFSLVFFIAFFSASVLFSVLLNGLLLNFAKTLGIRNNTEGIIRWSSQAKPALGGISFYLIFLFSIIIYSIFYGNHVWANKQVLGILVSCTIGFIVGLADDAYNTRPVLKFMAQVTCGIAFVFSDIYINILPYTYLNYLLTIIWVVGIMNSINMLDNMDGITASVSAVILAGTLTIIYFSNTIAGVEVIIITACLAAIIGFLFYNWHPSKMFMGDTGSQFLGALLSAIGILYFWNLPYSSQISNTASSKKILTAALIFIIPIIDTTTVVINRLLKKKSPFVGGKDHTTHHLFYIGYTEKRIAIIFILLSSLSAFLAGVCINNISNWGYLHITLFSGYIILLFLILYLPTKKIINKKQEA